MVLVRATESRTFPPFMDCDPLIGHVVTAEGFADGRTGHIVRAWVSDTGDLCAAAQFVDEDRFWTNLLRANEGRFSYDPGQ